MMHGQKNIKRYTRFCTDPKFDVNQGAT